MKANLVVRSVDNKTELPIAKVVPYRGSDIVHAYIYSHYQRYSIQAWGVRYPLAAWMAEKGIRTLYLWDNGNAKTYVIDLATVRRLGTEGQRDQYGGTLNVPQEAWRIIPAKLQLPWVPDDDKVILP